MRVAVTGGSGRIGQFVVRLLGARGHEVISLDRAAATAREPGARYAEVDLRDGVAVRASLERVEAVCHLGEMSSVGAAPPAELFAHNTLVTSNVMQAAAELGLRRAIYTSSCQVYGMWNDDLSRSPAPKYFPLDEEHPLHPCNAYALSKVANEGYARLMAERHGLAVTVFRLPGVIVEEVVPQKWFVRLEKERGKIEGMGTYLHARDAAMAYALALERPTVGGKFEAYHLVADDYRSAMPLRERLAKYHPDYPPLPADLAEDGNPVSTRKAREQLGWQPKYGFLAEYRRWKAGLAGQKAG